MTEEKNGAAGKAAGDHRIDNWPVEKLIPYENSARTHSAEQVVKIAASIVEFGFTNPILVSKNGIVIAGHGRLEAAKSLGLREVPVLVLPHLTEKQRRALTLADNRLAEDAGWDYDKLAHELDELRGEEFDLPVIGFTREELNDLIGTPNEVPLPTLPTGDKSKFQNMTFTLHDEQAEQVRLALKVSVGMGAFDGKSDNGNGNALARVCKIFLTQNGKQ